MGRPAKKFSDDQKQEIQRMFKENEDIRTAKKLMCLNLRAELMLSAREIGKITGYSKGRVDDIISDYLRNGIKTVESKSQGGNHRTMSKEKEAEIIQVFDGLASTGKMLEISDIFNKFQQEAAGIHLSTVYRILHRNGWRKVMPRSMHPKADPAIQEAYKKNSRQSD